MLFHPHISHCCGVVELWHPSGWGIEFPTWNPFAVKFASVKSVQAHLSLPARVISVTKYTQKEGGFVASELYTRKFSFCPFDTTTAQTRAGRHVEKVKKNQNKFRTQKLGDFTSYDFDEETIRFTSDIKLKVCKIDKNFGSRAYQKIDFSQI